MVGNREIPKRANIKIEITRYEFNTRENSNQTYFALGAVLKYFFNHSRDLSVYRRIVNQILESLITNSSTNITGPAKYHPGKQC